MTEKCSFAGCDNLPSICFTCHGEDVVAQLEDLQGAYDIAMQEITKLRKKLGYDKVRGAE